MIHLFKLLSHLPLRMLHGMGACIGVLIYCLSARNRRITRQNLQNAGLSDLVSPWQIAAHSGRGLLELPWVWLRPQTEIIAKVVKVSGWQYVDDAQRMARGIIVITPHLGCFEIIAQYYAAQKPFTAMYRRPKQDWLAPIVEQGRGINVRLAGADLSGVRTLMRTLKAGGAIGMLPDQVPGNGEGVWVPFFGKPAYTMTLAGRLATTGAVPLLFCAERLPRGAGFHLNIKPFPKKLDGTPTENATAINRALEDLIRECPEQYAWNYNRYKVPAGAMPPDVDAGSQ